MSLVVTFNTQISATRVTLCSKLSPSDTFQKVQRVVNLTIWQYMYLVMLHHLADNKYPFLSPERKKMVSFILIFKIQIKYLSFLYSSYSVHKYMYRTYYSSTQVPMHTRTTVNQYNIHITTNNWKSYITWWILTKYEFLWISNTDW